MRTRYFFCLLTCRPLGDRYRGGIVQQFVCFAGVGVIGTLVHYATLMALVHLGRVSPILSSVAGFVLGALVNYVLNYHVTFRSKKPHRETLAKFYTIALVGLGLNTLIMIVATTLCSLHYLVAQVIATAVVLASNFAGNRQWTFREVTHGSDGPMYRAADS
jgi:putative flippase GtrA